MTEILYAFRQTGSRSVESAFKRNTVAAQENEAAVNKALAAIEAYGAAGAKLRGGGFPRLGGAGPGAGGGSGGGSSRAPARREEQLARQVERDQIAAARRTAAEKARILAKEEAEERRSFARRGAMAERFYSERLRSAVRAAQRQGRAAGEIASRTGGSAFSMPSGYDLANGGLGLMGRGLAAGGLATGAALVGVGGLAARDAMRLQEASNRISIDSRKSKEGFIDQAVLRREFENVAISNPGVQAGAVADAVKRYITLTGDVGTARRGAGVFATVASATGSDVGDVAEAAASLGAQFNIKSLEDMKEVLAALTMQGREGSFELKDAAGQFQRLASSAAAFGLGSGPQAVKTLGGLTQIARSGTGSAEQAATAIENLFTNLGTKQHLLRAAGVDVYRGGKTRDIVDIIVDSISKVGGGDIGRKQAGLSTIFGEQGKRAINPLVAKYMDAYQGASGSDQARTAVAVKALRQEIERAINAPGAWADIQKDAAQAQTDSSAKLAGAWSKVTSLAGEKIVPVLIKFAESIAGTPELFEALKTALEVIRNMLVSMGVLKGDAVLSPEEERDKYRAEAIDAYKDAQAVPTEKKAFALIREGRTKEATEMLERMQDPAQQDKDLETTARYNRLATKAREADRLAKATSGPQTNEEMARTYASFGEPTSPEAAAKRTEAAVQAMKDAGPFAAFMKMDGETAAQQTVRSRFAAQNYGGGTGQNDIGNLIRSTLDKASGGKGDEAAVSSLTRALMDAAAAARTLAAANKPTI